VSAQLWFVGPRRRSSQRVRAVIVPQWLELLRPMHRLSVRRIPKTLLRRSIRALRPIGARAVFRSRSDRDALKSKTRVGGAYSIAFATHYETLNDAKAVVRRYALLEKPITLACSRELDRGCRCSWRACSTGLLVSYFSPVRSKLWTRCRARRKGERDRLAVVDRRLGVGA